MDTTMRTLSTLFISLLFLLLSACTVNPVTGEKQLMFSSFSEDVAIGKQQYRPAQQSQGGQYILDNKLSAYVSQVGHKLAAVSDVPKLPYEFVVLNNSVPNAWALPSGKIAINRGLLIQLESEAQLAAVLSHEIVHAAARHGAQHMRDNMLVQAGIAGLGLGFADNDYRSLIIGGASLGAKLTVAKYGRDHELESDQYGMKYMAKAGYDLQGAVELQKLFVELSKGSNSSWLEGLFASHPPSIERVNQNIAHLERLKSTGSFVGKTEYQQALKYLQSKTPAYTLADQASQALGQGQKDQALSLINQAIEIEPKEAFFNSIRGEIYQQQGKPTLALKELDKATTLNPNQFSYYLNRANTLMSLGQDQKAQADLERSMQLLPTSVAAIELGNLFEQSGHSKQAIAYYSDAASASGKLGQQARVKLAKLEINSTPKKYLKVAHFQDPKGPLLVKIENRSPLRIIELSLTSQLISSQGEIVKQKRWKTSAAIPSGKASRYYPEPVSYHLEPGEQVKTEISSVKYK
jgi:predicted Zn-dependent protease